MIITFAKKKDNRMHAHRSFLIIIRQVSDFFSYYLTYLKERKKKCDYDYSIMLVLSNISRRIIVTKAFLYYSLN
jgi:hypothetical protein